MPFIEIHEEYANVRRGSTVRNKPHGKVHKVPLKAKYNSTLRPNAIVCPIHCPK